MNWLKKALCESDGTPSSQRLMLVVLMVFTLDLLACGFYVSGGLPEVPASLADLIKWLFTAVIAGVGFGKVRDIVGSAKGATGTGQGDRP